MNGTVVQRQAGLQGGASADADVKGAAAWPAQSSTGYHLSPPPPPLRRPGTASRTSSRSQRESRRRLRSPGPARGPQSPPPEECELRLTVARLNLTTSWMARIVTRMSRMTRSLLRPHRRPAAGGAPRCRAPSRGAVPHSVAEEQRRVRPQAAGRLAGRLGLRPSPVSPFQDPFISEIPSRRPGAWVRGWREERTNSDVT